jgi:drug/metabolite transporter (DMT)-like permease
MTQSNTRLDMTGMLILIVLCASWGIQQVAIKVAIQGISPVLQAGIRSMGAAVLLLAWMRIRGIRFLERDKTLWWGIAAGLLFSGEFLLIYWGLKFTNASRAVIFLYMSPFVVAGGAQLFIPGDTLGRNQVLGLLLAFTGILAAFSESLTLSSDRILIGDLMLTGAAVLWGATTVVIKAGPLARIPPSKTLLYQLGVSAVTLPPGALVLGESGIGEVTALVAASLLYQVVWVAFITYLVWFWLVRNYPVSRLSSFTFLTPLFGVGAGGLFLGEPLSSRLMAALVLVGAGIYLVNRPQGGQRPS